MKHGPPLPYHIELPTHGILTPYLEESKPSLVLICKLSTTAMVYCHAQGILKTRHLKSTSDMEYS
jgi:hypothetical protein